MLRNPNVPQGIVANRLGFPLRDQSQPLFFRGDSGSLLRQYSDGQLDRVEANLVRSRKVLGGVRKAMAPVGGLGLLTSFYTYTNGLLDYAHMPFDKGLQAGFEAFSNVLSHVGIQNNYMTDGAIMIGLSLTLPLYTSVITSLMSRVRRSELNSVREEQIRRNASN